MTDGTKQHGLRWGILGPGGIAKAFAADLVLHGFDVRAVGSRSQSTADEFAAEYGVPNVHTSYESLVNDPEVDVVYIATPHPFHAEQAILALNAGKHVLIEKPFTLNAAEAQAVVALAAERGLVVLEAMWSRFLPHMDRIREIIAAGTLGELRNVTAGHNQLLSTDPAHRINAPELGGGALLDLSVYPISFASDLFGTPERIQASGTLQDVGTDIEVTTLFTYANGATAVTLASSRAPGPNRASIVGTKAWIEIDRTWQDPADFRVLGPDAEVIESYTSDVAGRGMQYQAWELERIVASGELSGDRLPVAETISIMETMDEVRRQIGVRYPGE